MMYKLLACIVLLLFKLTFASAEVINAITVEGNNRVSTETIIVLGEIKKGQDVSNVELNDILKNLYETNFFENINLNLDKNILLIKVKEYPVVQEIVINGIKRNKTVEEIKEQISIKEKNPFRKSLIK